MTRDAPLDRTDPDPRDRTAAAEWRDLAAAVDAWRRDRARAGVRLRGLRVAAGLTQVELAARSGLTHESISRLELGHRGPQAETVARLAEALGVAPGALAGDGPEAAGAA